MERGPQSKTSSSAPSGREVSASPGASRQLGLALSLLVAAGLISAPLFAAAPKAETVSGAETSSSQAAEPGSLAAAIPLESPDGDCFEWKYPNKPECGALAGKTECKAEPSINTLEKDEEKRKACAPEEGAECFCGEDDEDDEDDEDEDDDDE